MTMQKYYPANGSVSSGTMRSEDLLDTLSGELGYHMKRMRLSWIDRKRYNETIKDARAMSEDMNSEHPGDMQTASEIVDELFDALDEIAPPFCYFGAAPGDGAEYGFWPIIDGELMKIPAGDDIPRECWGEDIYIVNDHGNVECGYVTLRGKFKSYWSIV